MGLIDSRDKIIERVRKAVENDYKCDPLYEDKELIEKLILNRLALELADLVNYIEVCGKVLGAEEYAISCIKKRISNSRYLTD